MEGNINVVRLDLEDDNLGLEPEEFCETVEPRLKDDGNEKAKCNGCGQEYKIGCTYGTSHLHHHIGKCKQIKFHDVSQMMLDVKGGLTSRKIDQMVAREKCAYAIIAHDLPFSFVEYKKPPKVMDLHAEIDEVQKKEKELSGLSLSASASGGGGGEASRMLSN
ncbi:putative zinc finger BED domain-containing protein RICESLEEPER [Sesbania bispinosa]|nr:putative zinc finger BED domain-containing protein RICESLEEPER [Sesbania bispinosa]